ncbi:sensor histidine kinase [uncultured Tenacibaculum sp.]|uniref:sensor histidine kinase n=1 Tax=uncultured Tenacibaculum sp. TaxID=174713 RepID=UPI002612F56C|nr:sensor histidine kinase [uncultured Tenacibaculum sp.]
MRLVLCAMLFSAMAFSQEYLFSKQKGENKRNEVWGNLWLDQGVYYQNDDRHEKAIKYFKYGLATKNIKMKAPQVYANLIEGIAISNYVLGKKEGVIKKYNEAVYIKERLKNNEGLCFTHTNISLYYIDKKNKDLANKHAIKAFEYALKSKNKELQLQKLELILNQNIYSKSKDYFKKYVQLKDSLIDVTNKLQEKIARFNYQTVKREKENTLLKSENNRSQEEISYQKQQKTIGWLLTLISLLGLSIGSLFFVLRRRKLIYQTQLQQAETRYLERDRIAQELHDGVLSKLFGTRLSLGFLKLQGDIDELNKHQYLLNELQNVEKEIREVSHKLSHTISQSDNFKLLIKELFEEKSKIGGFEYSVDISTEIDWKKIDEKAKINIHRILQEVIQNCIKHAKANTIKLKIAQEGGNMLIKIEDNGVGFDSEKENKGIGLKNINSRIKKLKGVIKVNSKLGDGTTIEIELPIK